MFFAVLFDPTEMLLDWNGIEEQVATKGYRAEDSCLPVLRDSESTGQVLC